MRRNEVFEWMEVAASSAALGMEAASVIGLRVAGAAAGDPRAAQEAWRMWSEKIVALSELQMRLFTGRLGSTPSAVAKATLTHYRRKVRTNRRRLSS